MPEFDYDAELRRYHPRLCAAAAASPTDHVLDVGCGSGQTTRELARSAASVLGVDVSAPRLAAASRRGEREGLHNIGFVQADAQTHPFPAAHFDLAVSRFGTMFFADPVAAFGNIGRALRPGARFAQLVWRDGARQEWHTAIHAAFDAPTPPDDGPFSLADPTTVESVLTAAGFTDVSLTDVSEPVYYGPDADSALDSALALQLTQNLLAPLDPEHATHALDRLRAILATHQTTEGVAFDASAWLINARIPKTR